VCVVAVALVPMLAWPQQGSADHGNAITAFSGPFPHFAPLFIADAKGFFKKHGVNATVRLFDSGGAASAAFRGGRADFLAGCGFSTIRFFEGGDARGRAPLR